MFERIYGGFLYHFFSTTVYKQNIYQIIYLS